MMGILPKRLTINAAWSTGAFVYSQAARLVNNMVLARLLGPQVLGLMVVVNMIRTGVELISDVGITQNIVSHPKGERAKFFDTAWSIQAVRGLALGLICFLLAESLAHLFGKPDLGIILPVIALLFVLQGFDSGGNAILVKRMQIRRISVFEVGCATFSLVAHIALALITPTIWALVIGSVMTQAAGMVTGYFIIPGIKHHFRIDREVLGEVFKFGKWIFLSSLIYFAAMNFDRIYFSVELPLAALGVYGIARTLADASILLATNVCRTTLFPAVSQSTARGVALRDKLIRGRRLVVWVAALTIGGAIAIAGPVVDLLYDSRYEAATVLLPIMLVGVWFSLLSSINDSILVGLRRPAPQTIANLGKFAWVLVLTPMAFATGGLLVAVLVLSLGEVIRYVVLWVMGRREHVAFGRDDLLATTLLVIAAWGLMTMLQIAGLPSTSFEPLLDALDQARGAGP